MDVGQSAAVISRKYMGTACTGTFLCVREYTPVYSFGMRLWHLADRILKVGRRYLEGLVVFTLAASSLTTVLLSPVIVIL